MASRRVALAATLVVVCAVTGLAAVAAAAPAESPFVVLMTPSFVVAPTVGALILVRQPDNRIGWLFCLVGLGLAATLGVGAASRALLSEHRSLAILGGWMAQWLYLLFVVPGGLLIMTFPNGRVPSPRWRPLAFAFLAGAVASGVGLAFGRATVSSSIEAVPNPFAAPEVLRPILLAAGDVGDNVLALALIPIAAGVVLRLRRARGIERLQLKWFAYAVVATVVVALALTASPWPEFAFFAIVLGFGAVLPAASGIAILRYRLYDIDLVIRRTVVYGAVVVILGAVYVVLVLGLQALLSGVTGEDTFPVALSTLAIAALFGSVRRRVREAVDRRFYRSRYDTQRILEAFAARLRDEVALDSVSGVLTDTARRAVRPASAGVWIRGRPA